MGSRLHLQLQVSCPEFYRFSIHCYSFILSGLRFTGNYPSLSMVKISFMLTRLICSAIDRVLNQSINKSIYSSEVREMDVFVKKKYPAAYLYHGI